ncbi:hypothetical protein JZ751_004605 [Albula glossodonta]|uniref:Uncharacterized protein n=1 Tax=Albula glossodonta TaxID=121402 RepID=A0A8T2N6B0_9TELE|nr:hypothetical protein JZ751_004605 [Albula glossodonta]
MKRQAEPYTTQPAVKSDLKQQQQQSASPRPASFPQKAEQTEAEWFLCGEVSRAVKGEGCESERRDPGTERVSFLFDPGDEVLRPQPLPQTEPGTFLSPLRGRTGGHTRSTAHGISAPANSLCFLNIKPR